MTPRDSAERMPYPGLRPFEAEDEPIFFGREAQVSAMLRRLEDHRFVAVVGSSGCGKSSLVRAGLLPAIHEGFLFGTTSWLIPVMKPGHHPYEQLVRALSEAARASLATLGIANPADLAVLDKARTLAALRRTDRGLLEALREAGIPPDVNVVLVVDQFEELFAFRRTGSNRDSVASRDEAAAFVSMLLRSCSDPAGRVWVALTMRSDFIGDCEAFLGLPEAVSRSQFLVPRLDRGQMEEAIARPGTVPEAGCRPFTFEDGLVNRIINDAGDRPDQLPLLQHALMRTWKIAVDRCARLGAPLQLTQDDYRTAGEIDAALSLDADSAWKSINGDPRLAGLARRLFLLLCDISPDGQITRRRPTVGEIQAATGASVQDITRVVRAFQEHDRNFLLPPLEQELTSETPLDVSHEALLRRWQLFADIWLEQERRDVSELRRLLDLAGLHDAGNGGLLQAQDLERVTQWRSRVSAEWASRYVPNARWHEVVAFIDASERDHRTRTIAAAKARERALRRARWSALAFGAVAVVLAAGLLRHWLLFVREDTSHYNSFVKVYGAPRGIGLLTAQQVQHRPWSMRIVRKGRRGPVLRMEAVNSRGAPTGRHSVGTYVSESTDEQKEVRWDFVYGANDRVAYEVASDKRGQRVWTLIYSPTGAAEEKVRLARFVGPDGYPRAIPGYGTGFVRIEYSPEGYESLISYRNPLGEPRAGLDRAFGRRQTFDAEGRLIDLVSVDPEGHPMIDEAGNAGLSMRYDVLGNSVEDRVTDASGAVTTVKDGYARVTTAYDSNGNLIERAFFDEKDRPTQIKDGYHRWSQRFDDRGRPGEWRYWDVDARPAVASAGCHGRRFEYDERDNVVKETCLGMAGTPAPNHEGVAVTKVKFDERDAVVEIALADAAGRAVPSSQGYSTITFRNDERGNRVESAYFGTDGKPFPTEQGYSMIRSEYDSRDNEIGRSFFGPNGKPIVIANAGSDRKGIPAYAKWERRYDGDGNQISEEFFDVEHKPMIGPNGYASWRNVYDKSGNRIEVAYFGTRGQRVLSRNGYSGWRMEYDGLGRQIGIEYFDTQGALVAASEGIAGWHSQLDGQGNEIDRRYYDVRRRPARDTSGTAGWQAQYDRRGNKTDVRYIDTQGKPTLRLWNPTSPRGGGYARRSSQFDARGRIVEDAYFGLRGERVVGPALWARVVNRYDPAGENAVESAYFGADNKPVLLGLGYHMIKRRLDGYGRVVEETYFDRSGAAVVRTDGIGKMQNSYDMYGRLVEEAVFALDGSPVAAANGAHKAVRRYDEQGRAELRWFGLRNEPLNDLNAAEAKRQPSK